MSFFASLKSRFFGEPDRGGLVGAWTVTDISVPHPFAQYVLQLLPDGSLAWSSVVPTTDAGEFKVKGSGTWRTSGDELHYTSGSATGKVLFQLDGQSLVLDGLPATKIGPGVRCVLKRVPIPASV